jgi:parallel beta-helix repeat protein
MAVLSGNVSVVAAGATVYVDDDNTDGPWDGSLAHPYWNITSGLAHASDGDTVYVFGGTYYENVVVNKSVTLEGDSNPVIDGMGGSRGIDIAVNNVIVQGFNITNSEYCIYTNASGFSITNNVFWYSYYEGFYWEIYEGDLAEDYTLYDCTIMNNEFYTSGSDAVYVAVDLDYYYNSGYDVAIGDVTISDNTFHMDGTWEYGIDVYEFGVDHLPGGTISVGALNMSGNAMYGGGSGIVFYGSLTALNNTQASLGDVIISNNVMVNQTGDGMDIDYYDVEYLYGNTIVTLGDLIITGNTITSAYGGYGIYVSDIGYWDELTDYARLEVGSVYIEENEIDVSGGGIFFHGIEVGCDLYDYSSFEMGHILVRDNTINSDGEGMYLDFAYFGSYMYGNSSFSMSNVEITGNTVDSGLQGIYLYRIEYLGYKMHDNSSFTMGSILVNDNTVNSDDYGIAPWFIRYFGSGLYGNSSFTMSNIEFCKNTVNSTIDAIGFSQFTDFGTDIYGNSSFSMGSVLVNDNALHSFIWLTSFGRFGAYLYENSSCTMGNVEFCRNVINSVGKAEDGITFYNLLPFGYEIHDYSSFIMGDFSVSSNTIVADGDRFGIACTQGSGGFGINVYDNASALTGNFEFAGNNISFTHLGFNLWVVKGAIIRNNTIRNSTDTGIFLPESSGNHIYHNNFINNTVQAYVTVNYNNTWDNGYPSGGNYWSDCTSADLYSGPDQNIPGSDFRGDTSYVINKNNTDHYPLTIPYETKPPTITILSPENKTYSVNILPLTFTVDETTISMGYSLDGQAVVPITGNSTLPALSDGSHHVTVYANDTFDNMGSSTVYFTADITPPTITILSPENKTYSMDAISLTFTVSESISWIGYSLDGQANTTITGNTTLTGLSDEMHGIRVYARDIAGNTGFSDAVYFTVDATLPSADAGPSQTVDEDTVVTFDGSASTDENGIATYTWTFTDSTPKTLSGKNPTYTFATPRTYVVTLEVADPAGNTATDTVTITVLDVTDPVANAGSDRTVNEDISTTLDGSGSTDNAGITGYTWTFTDVTVKTLTGDKPAYTFSNPGVYTITLNVTDAAGNWATDTVVITVLDVTDPVANAGQDQTVNAGETVSFDAGGSADNVGIVSYEWDFGDETSGTGKTATHEYTDAGTYTVTLTAKDAAGNQATDTMIVTMNAAEAFPWWIVAAAAIVVVGIVVAALVLWRRRKKA